MDFLNDSSFREELKRRLAPIRAGRPQTPPRPSQMSIKELMELERDGDGMFGDASLTLFRLALERGADPNRQSGPNGETMLHTCAMEGADAGRPLAELFLEHGANPNLPTADERTPYSIAVRMGNTAVAHLLLMHGAKSDSASPADQFIGACRRVDSQSARAILSSHPDILKTISSERGELLDNAVIYNQLEAVRLMAKLGFDLAAFGNRGASPLHHAAWHGHAEIVRLLIGYHAPVNVRDAVYGTSPLAWAAHGSASSKYWREADADYCAVVESLMNAGANYAAACNTWGVGPEQIGSERVVALLKSRGFYRT